MTVDLKSRRIRITIGGLKVEAELNPTRTAQQVYEALPIETKVNTWGEEFYCKLPGVKDHRETATTRVKIGDVAFWGAGEMLAIFFGRTPMSLGADPVPADRVNILGKVIGDATILQTVMDSTMIKVEPIP